MRVSVIGIGLIGGSLGQALVAGGRHHVTGWDRDADSRTLAVALEAAHAAPDTLVSALAGAEVVVVATPVRAMRGVFEAIAPHLPPGCVVTDVGSTKRQVAAWARALLPPGVPFVGGHPMAGAEHAGVASARPELFDGATYCVTPEPDAPQWAIERVEALALAVGGRLVRMTPEVHDHIVAGASHLPLLASAALMHTTTREPGWEEALGVMAATGYRDATRLASGDATMHRDICVTNAEEIRPLLLDLADTLREAAERLDDPDAIEAWLRVAQERRAEWLARSGRLCAAAEVARPDAAPGA